MLEYRSGELEEFLAEFAANDGCELNSHLRLPATTTKFFLIDGRESYAWLGVNSKYRGLEIENYYHDADGHHFSFRERHRAWQYHIPDQVGADGVMEYFEETNMKIVGIGDGFAVEGEPMGQCELTFVRTDAEAYTPEPASQPPPAPDQPCSTQPPAGPSVEQLQPTPAPLESTQEVAP